MLCLCVCASIKRSSINGTNVLKIWWYIIVYISSCLTIYKSFIEYMLKLHLLDLQDLGLRQIQIFIWQSFSPYTTTTVKLNFFTYLFNSFEYPFIYTLIHIKLLSDELAYLTHDIWSELNNIYVHYLLHIYLYR